MMGTILWMMPCAIYTLHTMELILTVFAALLSGFLMKLLVDQFRSGSKTAISDELQTELETLQNRFSAEMLRKEEEAKLLQDEVKAADMRNVELQVQYAKALHFIEQLRAGATADGQEPETEDGRQILHNLQEKIAKQERSLLELEQQLVQANQSKEELTDLYQQLLTADGEEKSAIDKIRTENSDFLLQLRILAAEKEELQTQHQVGLQTAAAELKQLQEELNLFKQKEQQQLQLDEEVQRLRQQLNELQLAQQENAGTEMSMQKAGITAIRTKAGEVASSIEQFRDHLTTILRDSYSYEQLLASNERLQASIQKLQEEKREADEQLHLLQQLQEEKAKLEEQSQNNLAEFKEKEQNWLNQLLTFESSIVKLKEEIAAKEELLNDLDGAKKEMEISIDELTKKLEEKERQSSEMLRVVKDIESRFAHLYMNAGEQAVIDETGEMQYR
jgi:hypothetical protein